MEGWTSHKIPKGIVQNSLEELAKSGELSVTGKTGKVYWFNQVSKQFCIGIHEKKHFVAYVFLFTLLSVNYTLKTVNHFLGFLSVTESI